eukprot:3700396-Amphidinium_carterae.1
MVCRLALMPRDCSMRPHVDIAWQQERASWPLLSGGLCIEIVTILVWLKTFAIGCNLLTGRVVIKRALLT